MKTALILLLGGALAASPLAAQVKPKPGSGDPRIQTIDYSPEQVVQLEAVPGYQITVELSPGEQIENVAVGDSGAWQVTANHRGDHLFVKAVQAGVTTNMTVVTNVRLYNFELAPLFGGASEMPYSVRFRYPADAQAPAEEAAPAAEGRYRLTGDKVLQPSEISDDGHHTYIRWPRERSLPAAYALDDNGRETLVNGMMRDDIFVIDSVSRQLVFRLDGRVARAERVRSAP